MNVTVRLNYSQKFTKNYLLDYGIEVIRHKTVIKLTTGELNCLVVKFLPVLASALRAC